MTEHTARGRKGQSSGAWVWASLALTAVTVSAMTIVDPERGAQLVAALSFEDRAAPTFQIAEDPALQNELAALRGQTLAQLEETRALKERLAGLETMVGPFTGAIPPDAGAGTFADGTNPPAETILSAEPVPPVRPPEEAPALVIAPPLELTPVGQQAVEEAVSDTEINENLSRFARNGAETAPATVTNAGFALELGTATRMDDASSLWASLRDQHGDVLDALDARVRAAESDEGRLELRLIVGPFENAADAIFVCTQLRERGQVCRNTLFDGQQLAMR